MSRPERQPGARIPKLNDPHPALSAGGGTAQPDAAQADPPASVAPSATSGLPVPAAPQVAAEAAVLVSFNTRIPVGVRDGLRYLAYSRKRSIQDLVIEACSTFIADELREDESQ